MFLFGSYSLILIAMAVIPAIVLLLYIYREDRLEKESHRLVIMCVVFGIISTFLAALTERIGMSLLGSMLAENSLLGRIIMYFGIVAFSEEGFKYLVLRRLTWNNPEFNCKFDGVVYAVAVSLGFALWENIQYVISYGFSTALIRAVTAVPGHASFGVIMGAWYGLAKRKQTQGWRFQACKGACGSGPRHSARRIRLHSDIQRQFDTLHRIHNTDVHSVLLHSKESLFGRQIPYG